MSSQKQEQINYCRKCAAAGFATERIIFKSAGTKPDGSKKWDLFDYFSPDRMHVHKGGSVAQGTNTGQEKKDYTQEIERRHGEVLAVLKELLIEQRHTNELLSKSIANNEL